MVQPSSPAEKAGLKVGDLVLSINGLIMNKPEDYDGELRKYWPDDAVLFR